MSKKNILTSYGFKDFSLFNACRSIAKVFLQFGKQVFRAVSSFCVAIQTVICSI